MFYCIAVIIEIGVGGHSCLLFSQLFSQTAFGYVLPITSFVLAWLETWFLDFKVLTQEAEDERGERIFNTSIQDCIEYTHLCLFMLVIKVSFPFKLKYDTFFK